MARIKLQFKILITKIKLKVLMIMISKDLYLQYLIQELILVEEQEPRKKGAETKSHISPLSHNKWSLLGVIVLIVAVLYPFKMFYE